MFEERYALIWVLPALLLVLLFTLYPVADALYRSLHRVIVILPTAPFVGLANYREVVTGHGFWEAVRNTTAFAAVTARSPSSPALAQHGCCSPPFTAARSSGRW